MVLCKPADGIALQITPARVDRCCQGQVDEIPAALISLTILLTVLGVPHICNEGQVCAVDVSAVLVAVEACKKSCFVNRQNKK